VLIEKEAIMVGPASVPKNVLLSGPVAEYGPGFAAEVQRLGFTPFSAEHQLRLLAHLSRWMQAGSLEVGQLTPARVDEFLAERRASYTPLYSRRALRPLLAWLCCVVRWQVMLGDLGPVLIRWPV
jgi:integrase/recombinase XerD